LQRWAAPRQCCQPRRKFLPSRLAGSPLGGR
jgi:hypothetical protein